MANRVSKRKKRGYLKRNLSRYGVKSEFQNSLSLHRPRRNLKLRSEERKQCISFKISWNHFALIELDSYQNGTDAQLKVT